jgi:hypothetical protein
MSITINGVVCEEIIRGYQEGLEKSLTGTKSYLCPWNQRGYVIRGMIGYATFTARNGTVTFNGPFSHPEAPNIFAKSISIQGVGMPYQGPVQLAFAAAIITVQFGVMEWEAFPEQDPGGDQQIDQDTKFLYCTQSISYGAEYHSVPGSKLQILHKSDLGGTFALPFNQDKQIRVSHAEMSMTFHRLPYMPTNFLPLQDNVNDSKFLGCAKGTVKFNGGETTREQQSDGSITQSVRLSLSYRPRYEWNMAPDPYYYSPSGGITPGPDAWAILQYKTGDYIFPYSDLSVIFPPGYLYS